MSVWRVCERAELGQVGRQWELEKSRPLSIGRSTESDVQIASKSVENKHAVFEWSSKMVAFTVRDLGSINGTYINNRPISRGGSGMLNHGDVVRLGYEKSQVFRIEERFLSPANSPAKTSVATVPQHIPQAATYTPSHKDPVPANNNISSSSTPLPTTVASPSSQQQFIGHAQQPQAVMVHNVPTYVQQQSPVPFVMPQYGYPPSPPISLHPTPVGHVTIPHAASSAFHPISPTHFLHLSTPPPMSSSSESPPISVDDLESSSDSISHSKPQRSDGRRAVEISNSPNLSKVSKLYGKPSWWGEEKATEKDNNQEFEFVKPGSQILRDYDRRVRSPSNCEDTASPRSQRLSASEDLRVQAMTKSRERECVSPASTWVVDFDSNSAAIKKRPSRFDNLERRPRSADPSPNRSPQIKKDLLPVTASTSLKRSSSTHRSPSSSPRRSPVMTRRPQSMTIKKKPEGTKTSELSSEQALSRSKTITKKPPTYGSGSTGSLTRSKTTVKKTTPTHTASARVRRSSLEKVTQATSGKSATKQVCVSKEASSKSNASLNDTYVTDPLSSSLDESQSQSDASLSSSSQVTAPETPASQKAGLKSSSMSKIQWQGGGGGEEVSVGNRPNSARKQWASDQSQAPADGLMLASIEARIRRLSKLAHSCSRQLSCLQRSLGDVPGITVHNIPPTSPLGSQRGSDQRLPEWRFNKEGDSIFRGMRTVEKWLKDIEATVKSIEIGGADDGGMASCLDEESTDYQAEYETTELESEVEAILMQDSMEEFYSFSDTEETP